MQNILGDKRALGFGLLLLLALKLVWELYYDMFHAWWGLWTEPGSFYAHAAFVPFFVAVMIWRNRERWAAAPWKPSWVGAVALIPTMGLLMLGKYADVTLVKSLSFILLLFSSAILLFGFARTRVLLFPLMFVIMMFPLFPDQLINVIAFPIQLKSTQIATFLLNLLTLHAVREGTMIQMESYKMAVEGACSGFKTLISLLTFSAAFAYLVEGAVWKRWTLFLLTAPLSLLINALRITFIGIVGELVSTQAAKTFHDWSGFIVLILAFTILFNAARLLNCESFLGIPLQDEEPPKKEGEDAAPVEEAPTGPETPWWEEAREMLPTLSEMRRTLPYALALCLVLGGALAAKGRVLVKAAPQPPIATAQVPKTLTDNGVTWTAPDNFMTDKLLKSIQDQLNPTRLINRDYAGTDGSQVEIFMTAGNARWTFHDPHNCSLGAGTQLHDIGVVTIPTKSGPLQVLEVHFNRNGEKTQFVMMYCYVVPSGVLQRTEQVHKALAWQMFFGDSGRQSYFLRFTCVQPGTEEEKRQQLMHFIGAMWDHISPVLTGKEPSLPEPPPVPLDDTKA